MPLDSLQVPVGQFLDARAWLKRLVRSTLRPRPKASLWQWLEKHVVIPPESGSPNPGPLRLSRFPVYRGLYDLIQRRGVHYFTFCASARVGKSLMSICVVLYWIGEKFGHVVWLDPTRKTALKLVRSELDHFLLQCKPVKALAVAPPGTPGAKTLWLALEKYFRGKIFRVLGSGAEADMHGFQAECAVINESDRCKQSIDRDAASEDKIIARTKQFAHTRLILRNSTPGEHGELGSIWQNFLRGSQHYCYLPCPHCGHYQRLTFFPETKNVPFEPEAFTEDGPILADEHYLPPGETREEKTGYIKFDQFAIVEDRPSIEDATVLEKVKIGYNLDAVETGATYCCATCARDIEWVELNGMLARYQWRSHNRQAPRDHVSAHLWAAFSPFEFWGILAKEFLEAKGHLGSLMKFWTLTLGLPFIRHRSAIVEDDLDRVIKRTPVRYVQGQIPLEAEILTITVDVQGMGLWFVIRAWGILWDHPDRPIWNALVDWGECINWDQIEEYAGLRERRDGTFRKFTFTRPDGTVREYSVTSGLVDSGHEAKENKAVYEFCLRWPQIFSPYKGGDQSKTRGSLIRISPILDDSLDLIWAWSDYFAAALYYSSLRDGRNSIGDLIYWFLPINIDDHYRKQLTNERQVEENGKMIWKDAGNNHLGDCEKMQEVLRETIFEMLEEIRAERLIEESRN